MNPRTIVTAAVIRDAEGRILLAKRPKEASLGGLWEFPGGKLEQDESPEDCLVRELREELGANTSIDSHLLTVKDDDRFELVVYLVKLQDCSISAIWHDEIRWVRPDNLSDYSVPPADKPVIDLLQASSESSPYHG